MRYRAKLLLVMITISSLMAFTDGCREQEAPTLQADYDFSVYFADSNQISVNELINSYSSETGIKIEPIFSGSGSQVSRDMDRALDAAVPVAAFVAGADEDLSAREDNGFIADFSTIDPRREGNSIPWSYRGKGLVADERVLGELLGQDDPGTFISALRAANYADWAAFASALSGYIKNGEAGNFTLNDLSFGFTKEKGVLAGELNGVYALAGATDSSGKSCALELLEQSLRTTSMDEWEAARSETTDEAITVMKPSIDTFITVLEDMTSHLAGRYNEGVRGVDFTNYRYYDNDRAEDIFMAGKAVFLLSDTGAFSRLSELNAEKAQHLIFLPIKLPYFESGLPPGFSGGMPINQSIGAGLGSSIYINGSLPAADQKKALDFLVWAEEKVESLITPLEKSVRGYYEEGEVYPFEFSYDLAAYEKAVSGGDGLSVWLSDEEWDESAKEKLSEFLFLAWYGG